MAQAVRSKSKNVRKNTRNAKVRKEERGGAPGTRNREEPMEKKDHDEEGNSLKPAEMTTLGQAGH